MVYATGLCNVHKKRYKSGCRMGRVHCGSDLHITFSTSDPPPLGSKAKQAIGVDDLSTPCNSLATKFPQLKCVYLNDRDTAVSALIASLLNGRVTISSINKCERRAASA